MTEMRDYRPPVTILYFPRLKSLAGARVTSQGPLDTGDIKVRSATGTELKTSAHPSPARRASAICQMLPNSTG